MNTSPWAVGLQQEPPCVCTEETWGPQESSGGAPLGPGLQQGSSAMPAPGLSGSLLTKDGWCV